MGRAADCQLIDAWVSLGSGGVSLVSSSLSQNVNDSVRILLTPEIKPCVRLLVSTVDRPDKTLQHLPFAVAVDH